MVGAGVVRAVDFAHDDALAVAVAVAVEVEAVLLLGSLIGNWPLILTLLITVPCWD